jgi:hypothetical protein
MMVRFLAIILLSLFCVSARAQAESGPDGSRILLTADRYYYVNCSTGNDANPGTASAPWLTLAHAYNYARNHLDLGGRYSIFVKLQTNCAGQNVMSGPLVGQRTPRHFMFLGDCADHAAVTLSTSGNNQFLMYASNEARFAVRCMTLAAADGGSAFLVTSGTLEAGDVSLTGDNANSWVDVAGPRSNFVGLGALSFRSAGRTNIGFVAEDYGMIALPVPLICTGATVFGAFAQADLGGIIDASNATVTHGACKGQRYRAISNGIVFTGGTHDPKFFPGDAPGVDSQGEYQ